MNTGRLFFGVVLVGVGTVFALQGAEVLDASDTIGRWWPISLVVLALLHAIDRGRVTSGAFVIGISGLGLLALTTDLVGHGGWNLVWPIGLIAAGIWLVAGWGRRTVRRTPDLETVEGIAVLSATRVATRSAHFRHASLTALAGGVTLDLTEAHPEATGAVVDASAILGSITVLVPRGWLVDVRGIPLLGGWDDTTDRSAIGSGAPRVEIRALVVLGGVEVKHAGRWLS